MSVTSVLGTTLSAPGYLVLGGSPFVSSITHAMSGVVRHYFLDEYGGSVACDSKGVDHLAFTGSHTEAVGSPSWHGQAFTTTTSGANGSVSAGPTLSGGKLTVRLIFKLKALRPPERRA